jgi:hypothetical protein
VSGENESAKNLLTELSELTDGFQMMACTPAPKRRVSDGIIYMPVIRQP